MNRSRNAPSLSIKRIKPVRCIGRIGHIVRPTLAFSVWLLPLAAMAETTNTSTAARALELEDGTAPETTIGAYARFGSSFPSDSSVSVISESTALLQFEAGGEYLFSSPTDGFAFELGVAGGLQDRRIFEQADGRFSLLALQASAIYRRPLWSPLGAYVRAMGQMNWAHLSITEDRLPVEIDDSAVGLAAAGTLGLELIFPVAFDPTPRGLMPSQWLSIYAEVGYLAATKLKFKELQREVDEDTEPEAIRRAPLDAGTLGLSGPVLRAGLSFRF
ncbi:MAG: hypothetical protein H6729_11520 [Deltaproteobacteria bacterium]|nr:hypothetical protein [Deltaproteobacteria bacterium]